MTLPMEVIDGMNAQPLPTLGESGPPRPLARARSRRRITVALVDLAVLGALLMLATSCSLVSADHASDLPGNVPLPAQSTFVKQTQPGCSTCTGQSWYFKVASTQPQEVARFYTAQLAPRGWREVTCQLYSPEHAHCLASDDRDVLTIMGVSQPLVEIAPPRGGVVLAITLLAV
jgi:hypothetical protein